MMFKVLQNNPVHSRIGLVWNLWYYMANLIEVLKKKALQNLGEDTGIFKNMKGILFLLGIISS